MLSVKKKKPLWAPLSLITWLPVRRCYHTIFCFGFFFCFISLLGPKGAGAQEPSDSAVFKTRHDSINSYIGAKLDSALELARKNLEFARALGKEERSTAHKDLAEVFKNSGDYEKSIQHERKSIQLHKELNDSSGVAEGYIQLGSVVRRMGQFDSALHYFKASLRIAKALNDTDLLVGLYNNMGNVYRIRSDLVRGLDYFQKALSLLDTSDDRDLAILYGNLGVVQKRRKAFQKALERYRQAQEIFRSLGDSGMVAATYLSIGQVLRKKGDSLGGYKRIRKAYRFFKKSGNRRREAIALLNIGGHYIKKGMLDTAMYYVEKGLEIGRSIQGLTLVLSAKEKKAELIHRMGNFEKASRMAVDGYERSSSLESIKWKKAFSEVAYKSFQAMGEYERALHFHKEWSRLKDTLQNEERAERLTRMEMRYKFEKEQIQDSLKHAKEMRVQQEELEKQRTIRNFLLGGGAVLLLFFFLLYDRFRVARKRKREVEEKKEEVDHAYSALHEKNKELEDSIHYASRIQGAILTDRDHLERTLGEHFVLFKPKEVVSGDFYWAFGDHRYAIWLAADCTGHGVPGAFMSMIGNRLFNEVVVEQGTRDPGTILERVRAGIIDALEQNQDEETKDGMDAALCVYDKQEQELRFAGAHNSLVLIQGSDEEIPCDGKIEVKDDLRAIEIKGDRSSIGRNPEKGALSFQSVHIPLKGGERIYTFSDGFPDQFGGEKGKKYRYRPFKQFLLSIQEHSMEEQGKLLEEEFQRWKKGQEQVDDVLVMGVKVMG